MTTRNRVLRLDIRGAIGSALPNSITGLNNRLETLRGTKEEVRNQIIALQRSTRGLARDSEEYAAIQEEIARQDTRYKQVSEEIREVSVSLRQGRQSQEDFQRAMRRGAVVAGIAVGIITGLGLAVNKLSGNYRDFEEQVISLNANTTAVFRNQAELAALLGDTDAARSAALGIAGYTQQLRLLRQGLGNLDTGLAARAGVNLFDLSTDPRELQQQLANIIRAATPERRDLLAQVFPPEVFITASRLANATSMDLDRMGLAFQRAVLTGTQQASLREFSRVSSDLRASIGSLLEQAIVPLVPYFTQILQAVAPLIDRLSTWAQENPTLTRTIAGLVLGLAALVAGAGFLIAGLSGVGFVMIGLNAVSGTLFATMVAGIGSVTLAALPWIAVIALVAAGIYLVYRNWDTVQRFLISGIQFVRDNWMSMLRGIFPILNLFFLIRDHWDTIVAAIRYGVSLVVGFVQDLVESFNAIPLVPNIDTGPLERLREDLRREEIPVTVRPVSAELPERATAAPAATRPATLGLPERASVAPPAPRRAEVEAAPATVGRPVVPTLTVREALPAVERREAAPAPEPLPVTTPSPGREVAEVVSAVVPASPRREVAEVVPAVVPASPRREVAEAAPAAVGLPAVPTVPAREAVPALERREAVPAPPVTVVVQQPEGEEGVPPPPAPPPGGGAPPLRERVAVLDRAAAPESPALRRGFGGPAPAPVIYEGDRTITQHFTLNGATNLDEQADKIAERTLQAERQTVNRASESRNRRR